MVFWRGSVKEEIWGVEKKYSEREYIQETSYFKI